MFGPFWIILDRLDHSGSFWIIETYLDRLDCLDHSGLFRTILDRLDHSGLFWTILDRLDHPCIYTVYYTVYIFFSHTSDENDSVSTTLLAAQQLLGCHPCL